MALKTAVKKADLGCFLSVATIFKLSSESIAWSLSNGVFDDAKRRSSVTVLSTVANCDRSSMVIRAAIAARSCGPWSEQKWTLILFYSHTGKHV